MYVNPSALICTIPALRVRDCLRSAAGGPVGVEFFARRLHLDEDAAKALVLELVTLDYIALSDEGDGGEWYCTTEKGSYFALASGAPPISRATAERVVAAFMERVRNANAGDYYLFQVTRVVVFGSYLTDAPKLNDVDIAIDFQPRFADRSEHIRRCRARSREAERRFSNVVERIAWPTQELLLFLKSRSRAISLHPTDDSVLEVAAHQEIYPCVLPVVPRKPRSAVS